MTILTYEKSCIRLKKLAAKWGYTTKRIERTGNRLAAFGPCEGMKPSTFLKFEKFLHQIAFLRKKEEGIISEIISIEKKHHYRRQQKLLKTLKPRKNVRHECRNDSKKKRRNRFWLFLLIVWLLLHNNRRNTLFRLKPQPR
jgi:hypothetical protein